jgi:hypothetical protein
LLLPSTAMRRLVAISAVLAPLAIALVLGLAPANAELENHVFTSRIDRLRLVVPRGWRESDAQSYPGLLLWMMRPDAKIVLTAEPFTRELYCSWPVTCRTSHDIPTMPGKLACALRDKLASQRMHVGPVQAGPKENEAVGLPSVWFEFDDGKHYMRQAVALGEDRAISLVLSTTSPESRASQVRSFEQALRTLRPLTPEELGPGPSTGSATGTPNGGAPNGGAPSGGTPSSSGATGGGATSGGATSSGATSGSGATTGGSGSGATSGHGATTGTGATSGGAGGAMGGAGSGVNGGNATGGAKAAGAGSGTNAGSGATISGAPVEAPPPKLNPVGPCTP